MPLLVLAGIPASLVSANKRSAPDVPGWTARVVPTIRSRKRRGLYSCWRQVKTLADAAGHDGAHIVAHHKNKHERNFFENDLRDTHRIVWLQPPLLA